MHGPVGDPLLSMQIDFPDTTGSTSFGGHCPRTQQGPANRKLATVLKILDGKVAVVALIFFIVAFYIG